MYQQAEYNCLVVPHQKKNSFFDLAIVLILSMLYNFCFNVRRIRILQLYCRILLLGKQAGKQLTDHILIKMLIKMLAVLIL